MVPKRKQLQFQECSEPRLSAVRSISTKMRAIFSSFLEEMVAKEIFRFHFRSNAFSSVVITILFATGHFIDTPNIVRTLVYFAHPIGRFRCNLQPSWQRHMSEQGTYFVRRPPLSFCINFFRPSQSFWLAKTACSGQVDGSTVRYRLPAFSRIPFISPISALAKSLYV